MKAVSKVPLEVVVFVVCLLSLSYNLGHLPGMHGDEAWSIVHAYKLGKDYHPLNGMNSYTGVLHLYLLVPLFAMGGYCVEVLRWWGVFVSALTASFMVGLVRLFVHRSQLHGYAAGLLVTFPVFVVFSRFGTEITTIVPLLFVAGCYALARAQIRKPRFAWVLSIAGGCCWGLSVYLHLIVMSYLLSLALVSLLLFRLTVVRSRIIWLAAAGFFVGIAPRLYSMLTTPGGQIWSRRMSSITSGAFWSDLAAMPSVVWNLWSGELLFLRFTGENLLPAVPVFGIVLLAALVMWLGQSSHDRFERIPVLVCRAVVCACTLVVVITPGLSLRYFCLSSLFLPLLLVLLLDRDSLWRQRRMRRVVHGLLIVVLLSNVTYSVVNYYVSFSLSGGKSVVFNLGNRIKETSNHFISTERLYRELIDRRVEVVWAKDFIAWSLGVLDLTDTVLEIHSNSPHRAPKERRSHLSKKKSARVL